MTTLAEQLRTDFEEEILAGRLSPGDRIDDRILAERYGVSRTPIREAILKLSSLGLVEVRPRQRSEIASISLARFTQMNEVMSFTEAQAARLAARRMTDAQRAELLSIQSEAAAIVESGDSAAFNQINWRLHLAIFAGTQNAFLEEQARNLRLRMHLYRCYLVRRTGRMPLAHQEHEKLVRVVTEGDADAAFEVMQQHLSIDADRLADFVATLPEAQYRTMMRADRTGRGLAAAQ